MKSTGPITFPLRYWLRKYKWNIDQSNYEECFDFITHGFQPRLSGGQLRVSIVGLLNGVVVREQVWAVSQGKLRVWRQLGPFRRNNEAGWRPSNSSHPTMVAWYGLQQCPQSPHSHRWASHISPVRHLAEDPATWRLISVLIRRI